jgi:formate dehydrogenase iron-sulfur subunit
MTKTPQGPVVYDPDKCIGCRYCMLACPFHIPRYEWDETLPFVTKCMMCVERLRDGGVPACVEACPNDVLTFGEREELLCRAHERLRRQPEIYQQRVWGETEFGGTSVLYISDVDLSALGWPGQPTTPIPGLTEPLIHSTPFIGLTVAAGLLGVNWVVKRRMKLDEERRDFPENTSASTPEGAP